MVAKARWCARYNKQGSIANICGFEGDPSHWSKCRPFAAAVERGERAIFYRSIIFLLCLLEKLNLTYLALAGNNVGCVKFLGVTTLSEIEHVDHPIGQNGGQRLLLVFERATEGSLLEYLDRTLPKLSFLEAWDRIIAIVSNIANGLHSLHRHHIIHR
jgi:serine/threonine protein kinase